MKEPLKSKSRLVDWRFVNRLMMVCQVIVAVLTPLLCWQANQIMREALDQSKRSNEITQNALQESRRSNEITARAIEESRLSRATSALQIQDSVRRIYFEIDDNLAAIDAYNYPSNGRHYDMACREKVREYFTRLVFHEFLLTNKFQGGVLMKEWDNYAELIRTTVTDIPLLQEEYAYHRRMEKVRTDAGVADSYFRAMDKLTADLNLDYLLARRTKDVAAAEKSKAHPTALKLPPKPQSPNESTAPRRAKL